MRFRSGLFAAILISLGAASASAQTRVVTGKVIDSLTSEVITSGQVSVVGTAIGTTIKEDGTFTLAAPSRDVYVAIRSIGFKRRDVSVPVGQNSVQAALERDYFQLEAIVVTGQATGVERRNLANAVASISADQLTKVPTASVERALQGKVTGATITDNNGAPGGGSIVRMRGVTSLIGAFTPLYVLNGVIVSDAAIGRGTNRVTAAGGTGIAQANDDESNPINRIADINPNDIESVEVLKGAAASAIYGSKAANGVIIITTKKGRVGAPQFNVTQRYGQSRLSKKYGTRCYNSVAEATTSYGAVVTGAVLPFVAGQCLDIEDHLFKPGRSYETSASMNGGTESTRYYASVLNKHEGGIIPRTYADKQGLTLNVDQNVGSRMQISLSSQAIHMANDRGLTSNENNGSTIQSSMAIIPSWVDWRGTCPDGSIADSSDPCEGVSFKYSNPYGSANPFQTAALMTDRESVWRAIGTARVQLEAVRSSQHTLRFIATGGGDVFTQKNKVFAPPVLQFAQAVAGTSATSFSQNQNFNINTNAVHIFKTGTFSATTQAGLQFESSDLDIVRTLQQNMVGGQSNLGLGSVTQVEQNRQRVRDMGVFVQEEFLTLGEKLLVTVGGRADQSSNNSDPTALIFYPKSSMSYRFVKLGLVDELKLRAAYGQSGNRPLYGQKFTELAGANIGGVPTLRIAGVTGAPDLSPEREREIEGGFDATLFGSRANLEFTVYDKQISDVMLQRTLAPSYGLTTLIFNGGTFRTRGMEAMLNLVPVQTSAFQWNARVGGHMSRCQVMDLGGLPAFRPTSRHNSFGFGATFIEKDSSCTQIYGNDTLGADPTDAANVATRGALGTKVLRKVYDQQPLYNITLSNDVTFKRLRLYFLWERQKGGVMTNLSLYQYDAYKNSIDQTVVVPGYTTDGTTGDQRITAYGRGTIRPYTFDTSFWRMRDITLTLDLPQSWYKNVWSGARFIRLSASGRNLVTISNYRGYDPEGQEMSKSLANGANWELWGYPPNKQVWFSLDVGF
ncbi:MAG: SusC/RagA family TonB-linked outer membrane protein [Gemmatimonadetes bacterium]|nr:SusC/RagA family TonB-linked outer membrane protein [Gemmatimonadota bacterium]